MKRKLLMLAAAVLIAALLAGCDLPYFDFNTITVKYDLEEDVFRTYKDHEVRRDGRYLEIIYLREVFRGVYDLDDFTVVVRDSANKIVEPVANPYEEDGVMFGIFLHIPDVGRKDLTISIFLKK
ncbi:MAG: hypothetical protein WBK16_06200 [Limnochordia bacterium]